MTRRTLAMMLVALVTCGLSLALLLSWMGYPEGMPLPAGVYLMGAPAQ